MLFYKIYTFVKRKRQAIILYSAFRKSFFIQSVGAIKLTLLIKMTNASPRFTLRYNSSTVIIL